MKRFTSLIMAAMLALSLLAGCNGSSGNSNTDTTGQTGSPSNTSTTPVTADSETIPNSNTQPSDTNTPSTEPSADASTVYMTTDISSESLMAIYEALEFDATGNVVIKLSMGEQPNSNYLRSKLIKELVQSLDGMIIECNTAYGGSRASTVMHLQVAIDHGFTEITDVDIMDAEGEISLPVAERKNVKGKFVGSHFAHYDSFVVLSHLTVT